MLSLYYEDTLPVVGANAGDTAGPSYPQRICTEKSDNLTNSKKIVISHK
jgi:hypothetical protein